MKNLLRFSRQVKLNCRFHQLLRYRLFSSHCMMPLFALQNEIFGAIKYWTKQRLKYTKYSKPRVKRVDIARIIEILEEINTSARFSVFNKTRFACTEIRADLVMAVCIHITNGGNSTALVDIYKCKKNAFKTLIIHGRYIVKVAWEETLASRLGVGELEMAKGF